MTEADQRTREEAVVALLRALDDWVPGPRTSTGILVASSSKRGESDKHWFECPRCSGRRLLGQGRAERRCDRCGGEGRVKGDPYTFGMAKSSVAVERERVTGEAESALLRRQEADREIRKLALADKHRRGEIDDSEEEPWERAKRGLERAGSFAALRDCLRRLRAESEYDYAAVRVVYGFDSELRTVGPGLQACVDRAVTKLAGWMPEKINVPPSEPRHRDEEIRALAMKGVTQAKIAERFHITQQAVSKICRREAA